MRVGTLAFVVSLLTLCATASAYADVLITVREASLPDDDKVKRGLPINGPRVLLASPLRDPSTVKSPFALVIDFEPRDSVPVDLNSLEVTYERKPAVDLTERVKAYLSPTGIAMPQAETPPGKHHIHVEIKDVDGRLAVAEFTIDTTQ